MTNTSPYRFNSVRAIFLFPKKFRKIRPSRISGYCEKQRQERCSSVVKLVQRSCIIAALYYCVVRLVLVAGKATWFHHVFHSSISLATLIVLACGGGFFVFKKIQEKKKEQEAAKPDPDADYVDDDEDYGYVESEEYSDDDDYSEEEDTDEPV